MLRHRRKSRVTQEDKIFQILQRNPEGLDVMDIMTECRNSGDASIAGMVSGAVRRNLQQLLAKDKVTKAPSGQYDSYGRSIPIWYPV